MTVILLLGDGTNPGVFTVRTMYQILKFSGIQPVKPIYALVETAYPF